MTMLTPMCVDALHGCGMALESIDSLCFCAGPAQGSVAARTSLGRIGLIPPC